MKKTKLLITIFIVVVLMLTASVFSLATEELEPNNETTEELNEQEPFNPNIEVAVGETVPASFFSQVIAQGANTAAQVKCGDIYWNFSYISSARQFNPTISFMKNNEKGFTYVDFAQQSSFPGRAEITIKRQYTMLDTNDTGYLCLYDSSTDRCIIIGNVIGSGDERILTGFNSIPAGQCIIVKGSGHRIDEQLSLSDFVTTTPSTPSTPEVTKPVAKVSYDSRYSRVAFVKFDYDGVLSSATPIDIDINVNKFGQYNSGLKLFEYNESTKQCTCIAEKVEYSNGIASPKFSGSLKGKTYAIFCEYDITVGQTIPIPSVEGGEEKPMGPIVDNSAIMSELTAGAIKVSSDKTKVVSKEYFEVAKESKKPVKVAVDNAVWEFAAKDLTDTSIALNPHVESSSKREAFSVIQSNLILDAVFVDFTHNGNLPGKAKVTLNVGTEKFGTASKTLYMYYYNPSNNGYEYVADVPYQNGLATVEITHCSTYALMDHKLELTGGAPVAVAPAPAVAGKLDNEPKAGEISLLPIAMLSMISLAVAVVIKK